MAVAKTRPGSLAFDPNRARPGHGDAVPDQTSLTQSHVIDRILVEGLVGFRPIEVHGIRTEIEDNSESAGGCGIAKDLDKLDGGGAVRIDGQHGRAAGDNLAAHGLAIDGEVEKNFRASGSVGPALIERIKYFIARETGGNHGGEPVVRLARMRAVIVG